MDAQGPGSHICFAPGVYRLAAPLEPSEGQRLTAAGDVVLSGAQRVTAWRRHDATWQARGALPTDPFVHGECREGAQCGYAETVFVDGEQLQRVASAADVRPGAFWADYASNEIVIGDDPGGKLVEVARAEAAVYGAARDVVVDGFVVEKFANAAQTGALHSDGGRWRIVNNEVRLNHGGGVHADGGTVRRNRVHRNGQIGVIGTGHDLRVEGNDIHHNNTVGFSDGWEAGGTKFDNTDGLVLRGNYVHDNDGPGLWTDINNIRSTIEDNTVYDNASHGIFHEISYSAVIRGNRVIDNGRGDPLHGWGATGIRIAESRDVDVVGNEVSGDHNAIVVVQQDRDDSVAAYGSFTAQNIDVHDNKITVPEDGVVGMVDDTGSMASFGRDIRFFDNVYRLPSLDADVFAWNGGLWDSAAWAGQFSHGRSSEFVATTP